MPSRESPDERTDGHAIWTMEQIPHGIQGAAIVERRQDRLRRHARWRRRRLAIAGIARVCLTVAEPARRRGSKTRKLRACGRQSMGKG